MSTLVERIHALLIARGPLTTHALRNEFAQFSHIEITRAVNRLTRTSRASTNWVRGRPPPDGWTVRAIEGTPLRYRTELNEGGAPRLILEFLDLHDGRICSMTWTLFRKHGVPRENSKNATKKLMQRGWMVLMDGGAMLTSAGREALEHARGRSDDAKGLDWAMTKYQVARDALDKKAARSRLRQAARKRREIELAEKALAELTEDPMDDFDPAERIWQQLMGGARYQDIPAHLIRPLAVLRWTPPISARSLTGSSGAMLAESRSTIGTTP
jgi:hypothetical protein